MRTALVSYLYEGALEYLREFVNAIQSQSFLAFDIILFNDGVDHPEKLIQFDTCKITFVPITGTPAMIRFESLSYLKDSPYDYLIFQDLDDTMSSKRVEVIVKKLQSYNIVCNDLCLMSESGEVKTQGIWQPILGNNFEFSQGFIEDKNIVGFGNTGITRSLLQEVFQINEEIIAADWFVFFQLLSKSTTPGLFVSDCQTNYRQHENNIAGIKEVNQERINYVLKVKIAQYKGLIKTGFNFQSHLNKMLSLQNRNFTITDTINEPLLWWEETKFIQ